MFEGGRLTLLIGSLTVPVPASPALLEALQGVQVSADKVRTGFQLTFTLGRRSALQVMLAAGQLDPMTTRVVIVALLGAVPTTICDGVVTRHEVSSSNEAGQSMLTLTGEDLSVLMDVRQVRRPWPAVPDYGRVRSILLGYALYGITPKVVPPPIMSVRDPSQGVDVQTETDLEYVQTQARISGYSFYLQPGPVPPSNVAYFGPDLSLSVPQPALSVNFDWASNVDSLSFSLDGRSKKSTIITVLDPVTGKVPIRVPVPDINLLKPPLGARPIPPAREVYSEDLASLSPDEAAKRAFGVMREGADPVTASGSLSVPRYGHILRSRAMVGVRGAGLAYDGLYYVDSVTHDIKRGEYKQSFNLSRDGLVSQTPVLPVGGST